MTYKEYLPHPRLQPYIKCIWSLDARKACVAEHKDKILPDGCIELLFHYGDSYRQYYDNSATDLQQKSFVHGQLTRFIEIGPSGETGILAARFYPYGFSAFTDIPISHLTENTLELHHIWKEGKELEDKIMMSRNNDTRVQLLSGFLIQKLRTRKTNEAVVAHAVEQISAAKGNIQVGSLAKELHTSQRNLERMFQSSVGLNIKTFSRINRLQNVLRSVQQADSLTSLAHSSGYYDQAHFIRDFKHFTGESPSQYFSGANEMTTLFVGS